MSHAGFLRQHWNGRDDECLAIIRTLQRQGDALELRPLVESLAIIKQELEDLAGLTRRDLAILPYVARLSLLPRSMRAHHLAPLKEAGMDDRQIHDVVHVVACFSYMNRLADGTGVTLTETGHAQAIELFGKAALEAHLVWSNEG